ncbi:hypothetical protein [Sediminibacterium ginsengisoli]|uniref:Uncharacterized protein n=1 Tax=Sediminibacterium ginsengisoli TaxID=413434 RepID=A0A1T4M7T3_9BACT|nr:hypothetical protein [Sediminibacterium ginsengisoli]SJZ62897.1 hypothetical protein SAMN04488132_103225 [Sediminibacterium ginsengisoli]
MRRYVLLFAALIIFHSAKAQVNANEAKAAYLLAEECYGKADYKCALEYLQQVRTSLGTTNCKILYLQIMATRELHAKDPNVADKVLPLIDEFEKSADYASFNEEKSLEITKMKLALKKEQKALKEKTDRENAANAAAEKAFSEEFTRFGPLGITLDQLNELHPELNVKKWKKEKINTYHPSWVDFDLYVPSEAYPFCTVDNDTVFKNKISSVNLGIAGEKILQYRSVLAYADKKVNKNALAATVQEIIAIISAYERKLGFSPVISESVLYDKAAGKVTSYVWVRGNRKIELHRLLYPNGKLPVAKLTEIITSNN